MGRRATLTAEERKRKNFERLQKWKAEQKAAGFHEATVWTRLSKEDLKNLVAEREKELFPSGTNEGTQLNSESITQSEEDSVNQNDSKSINQIESNPVNENLLPAPEGLPQPSRGMPPTRAEALRVIAALQAEAKRPGLEKAVSGAFKREALAIQANLFRYR